MRGPVPPVIRGATGPPTLDAMIDVPAMGKGARGGPPGSGRGWGRMLLAVVVLFAPTSAARAQDGDYWRDGGEAEAGPQLVEATRELDTCERSLEGKLFREAIEACGFALELYPDLHRARYKLAEAWHASGDDAQALGHLRLYFDATGENPVSFEREFLARVEGGVLAQAESLAVRGRDGAADRLLDTWFSQGMTTQVEGGVLDLRGRLAARGRARVGGLGVAVVGTGGAAIAAGGILAAWSHDQIDSDGDGVVDEGAIGDPALVQGRIRGQVGGTVVAAVGGLVLAVGLPLLVYGAPRTRTAVRGGPARISLDLEF